MKTYDITKTQVLTTYDLELGYLKEDILTKVYPEVPAVQEQGHYETIRLYPNGGKDLKWVVDVKGIEYQPARIENEIIQVYVPYTVEQLNNIAIEKEKQNKLDEISRLKKWFDVYYTQHEQKYRRLIALGKLCDDGTNPNLQLNNLYLIAETNRAKINELESITK